MWKFEKFVAILAIVTVCAAKYLSTLVVFAIVCYC